jgi:hypothetical protein
MSLPLTKCLDPEHDYAELAEKLKVVDQHFHADSEQHPHRKWEYALALRAFDTWLESRKMPTAIGHVIDVGGSGSPFHRMLGSSAIVVDPKESDGQDLEGYLQTAPRLSHTVFCLSVLEHVEDLDQFCYHLSCLVAPGGLLFLTMDCCGCPEHTEPETHHFHWMRKRIFTFEQRLNLAFSFKDFQLLGGADWLYHGDHVYDYAFASLALVKRP